MKDLYSNTQKNLIMLFSDLLENPLSLAEKADLWRVLEATTGENVEVAIDSLSTDIREKIRVIMSKGLKFSLELNKLDQRGIYVLFSREKIAHFRKFFSYNPPILFAIGSKSLLDNESTKIFSSLIAFRTAGYNGIFIVDRAFDILLRDKQVVAAVRSGQALLISDLVRSRATTSSLTPEIKGLDRQAIINRAKKYVFISGSRSQNIIPELVQNSLNSIIKQNIGILIGDSNKGVDNEIIDFLRVPLYENVTIYTVYSHPRVNPETEWSTKIIESDGILKAKQRQTIKDRSMANDAQWGMALFKPIEINRFGSIQVSSGTLRNVIQMLLQNKMVKFFYVFENEVKCSNLKKIEDLEALILSYQFEHLDNCEIKAICSAKGVSSDDNAALVKFEKIMTKYNSLLKDEKKLAKSCTKDCEYGEQIQPSLF